MDEAARLEPPPMFNHSVLYMSDFSTKHSGAKSNNLKFLRGKLDAGVKLPESACIPFMVAEYSIGLEPEIQAKLRALIDQVSTVKSVKKMNKNLYQCKELICTLKFHEDDKHHRYLREQLIKFGIPAQDFEQAWTTIKRVWASKFNERAFLATKKLGVRVD